jgi:hypothetical protein
MALVYAKKYTNFPTPTVILQQGTGYRRAAAELLVAGATKIIDAPHFCLQLLKQVCVYIFNLKKPP